MRWGPRARPGWLYDEYRANRHANEAWWAWPIIIIFFFSIIGPILYWWTCRPVGVVVKEGEETKRAHPAYVSTGSRKTTGSVIGEAHPTRPVAGRPGASEACSAR